MHKDEKFTAQMLNIISSVLRTKENWPKLFGDNNRATANVVNTKKIRDAIPPNRVAIKPRINGDFEMP